MRGWKLSEARFNLADCDRWYRHVFPYGCRGARTGESGRHGGADAGRLFVHHESHTVAVELRARRQASSNAAQESLTTGSFGMSTRMSAVRLTANSHGS